MGEEVFIVGIVFGSILAIVFMGILGSIIKARIKSKNGSVKDDERFLEALREFKEKTDRRLTALEKESSLKKSDRKISDDSGTGSVKIPGKEEAKKEENQSSGKLKNMLKE